MELKVLFDMFAWRPGMIFSVITLLSPFILFGRSMSTMWLLLLQEVFYARVTYGMSQKL